MIKKEYIKGWLLKVYLEAEIFQELFEDNPDYIIEEQHQSDQSVIRVIKKNAKK